jgi:5-methylcytosine-specific restriction endonuclease McrA
MAARPPSLTRTTAPRVRTASPTYGWAKGSDRKWRKLRARKLDDEPRCERCLPKGRVTVATEVHHVVPISRGGEKYDYDNLQSVCGPCQDQAHGAKPKGANAQGFPTSPDHPWNR